MKKKVNFLMLAIATMLACLSFTSCDKDKVDDVLGVNNYYLQLVDVNSNLVDENGNSIDSALKAEWIDAYKADSQGKVSLGKDSDEKSAENAFYRSLYNIVEAYNNAYAGKNLFPEGGYFTLKFALLKEKSSIKTAYITVNNSGASY